MTVPMAGGRRVKDVIYFARQHVDIDRNLPEYKRNKLPDRRFL